MFIDMAITDPIAINFSNVWLRPGADRLARVYYRSKEASVKWNAISGTNAEKLVIMQPQITNLADVIDRAVRFLQRLDRLWNAENLNSFIPNDNTEILHDNEDNSGPDPNRPTLNGQDLRRFKNRSEEFLNYMTRGTDADKHWVNDAGATLPVINDYYDDVMRLTKFSSVADTGGQANTLISGRVEDILTEYETDNPNKLDHIVKVSVNPQAQDIFE